MVLYCYILNKVNNLETVDVPSFGNNDDEEEDIKERKGTLFKCQGYLALRHTNWGHCN